jgi:hypothetical protein
VVRMRSVLSFMAVLPVMVGAILCGISGGVNDAVRKALGERG